MEQIEIAPFVLFRGPDGELYVRHAELRTPVPVSRAALLRLLRQAVAQSLDFPGVVKS